MDNFKEFQGKDLDDCIRQALTFFNAPREKLEIELIQDAKSGIFGIVGARKAKIRAKRAKVTENMQTLLDDTRPSESENHLNNAHAPYI